MGRLQNRVALVTGGGSGIARAPARAFAREGARVAVLEIDAEAGRQVERELREFASDAIFLQADVTDDGAVRQAIDATVDRFCQLDVLFNCAGGSELGDALIDEMRLDVWQRTMALNLLGPFLCCRHALPPMLSRRSGVIVNVSSHVSLVASLRPIYAAAKAGVNSLTRSLAAQYSRYGIRANAIARGTIRSPRLMRQHEEQVRSGVADQDASERAALSELYPFSIGEPEDVAAIALFLASDESRMVNGATLDSDGGRSAYPRAGVPARGP
jgi:NAD(P)-dependent dehydrogenase (short-subunit alcohol dehydrogenase family)